MDDRRPGKPSNYLLPDRLIERAVQIIRERYADFGPTLACMKLRGVTLYKETVRKLMMQSGLWIPRRHRAQKNPATSLPPYLRWCADTNRQLRSPLV